MCDPVSMTLAASSAMSTAGGYLAGTSMLSGVGVGMINAASAINSSSAFVQGLRGVSLAMNVGNTLSAAGRIYGGSLQQQYNNQQAQLEQQKYVEQQKQMKAQIERDKLEARSQELDRRRTYLRNAASNISSTPDITTDAPVDSPCCTCVTVTTPLPCCVAIGSSSNSTSKSSFNVR